MKFKYLVFYGLTILAVFVAVLITSKPAQPVAASVANYSNYISTTTSSTFVSPTIWRITATSSTDISSASGTFGSFVQVAAGSGGNINIYDATTTDINKRWPKATSSILIASIPNTAAANTYTYDAWFSRGLLVVIDGTVGTTTITYRMNN